MNRGWEVRVLLLAKSGAVRGDAKINLGILRKLAEGSRGGLRIIECTTARELPSDFSADVIVDAIFGTGFSEPVTGLHKQAIESINAAGVYVASVDIPSGVQADTGGVETVAVKASLNGHHGSGETGACPRDGTYFQRNGDGRRYQHSALALPAKIEGCVPDIRR